MSQKKVVAVSAKGAKKNAKTKDEGVEETEFSKKYCLSNVLLGKGAYGEVKLGSVAGSETITKVAVKIMNKNTMKSSDFPKLLKEAKILLKLHHPNVVKVYDFYDEPDRFLIVMEYVDGGELFNKIVDDAKHFTEFDSRKIIYTVADALQHCKNEGVVHRDIKPENILLTKDGRVKLADFNLSKQLDADLMEFSLLQTQCGTPNYVAPEILIGKAYDYKCDVWSLGVIAFLLLSGGYLPFFINPQTEGRDELLAKVKEGRWRFAPDKAWISVSDQAKDLISNMLVKDPKKRFSYEQIMGHPWFKSMPEKDDELSRKPIMLTKMSSLNEKRRMLAASKTQLAVDAFAELMGPAEPSNEKKKPVLSNSGELFG